MPIGQSRIVRFRRDLHRLQLLAGPVPDLLWSQGTPAFCDVAGPRRYRLDPTESVHDEAYFRRHFQDPHGLVWLRASTRSRLGEDCDLDVFARSVLPTLARPVVIVTTDGDAAIPGDLRPATVAAFLDHPRVLGWYAQNHDGTPHPKLHPFPIGLDLHTFRGVHSPAGLVRALRAIRRRRTPIDDTLPPTVFCDVRLSLNSDDRRDLAVRLADAPHVAWLERRVPQFEVWRRYASHPFVLSPRGNGTDCHRTWEALLLGAIVVTRRVPIAPLFDGLAVLQIDDWAEVLDTDALEAHRARLAPLTEEAHVWGRLRASAWIDRIRRETGLAEATG